MQGEPDVLRALERANPVPDHRAFATSTERVRQRAHSMRRRQRAARVLMAGVSVIVLVIAVVLLPRGGTGDAGALEALAQRVQEGSPLSVAEGFEYTIAQVSTLETRMITPTEGASILVRRQRVSELDLSGDGTVVSSVISTEFPSARDQARWASEGFPVPTGTVRESVSGGMSSGNLNLAPGDRDYIAGILTQNAPADQLTVRRLLRALDFLRESRLDPTTRSTILRILASDDSLAIDDRGSDPLGRPAILVSTNASFTGINTRYTAFLDAANGQLLAERQEILEPSVISGATSPFVSGESVYLSREVHAARTL